LSNLFFFPEFCINTEPGSKSCTVVQGQLTITLADATDEKQNDALNVIIEGMTNDDYIGQDHPELIKVDIYYESSASALVNIYPEEDEDDSNLLAWLLALLAFLTFIILFFFITRKYRSRSNDDNLKEDDLDFNMDITDDDTTDIENDSPTSFVLGDKDSWVNDVEGYQDVDQHEVPDFNRLGKDHSSLNVHKCNSVLCEICLASRQSLKHVVSFESVHSSKYRSYDENVIT